MNDNSFDLAFKYLSKDSKDPQEARKHVDEFLKASIPQKFQETKSCKDENALISMLSKKYAGNPILVVGVELMFNPSLNANGRAKLLTKLWLVHRLGYGEHDSMAPAEKYLDEYKQKEKAIDKMLKKPTDTWSSTLNSIFAVSHQTSEPEVKRRNARRT